MTKEEFQNNLMDWCRSDFMNEIGFSDIKNSLNFLEHVLFHQYDPADAGGHGDFSFRLAKWIGSADNEYDQQSLFIMLKHLFFVGRDDMKSAHLTAYSKNVMTWLIETTQTSVFAPDAREQLEASLALTVFSEITDSFGIANFNHCNNIHGQTNRYTWEQHLNDWDVTAFSNLILDRGRKKFLILLEDFVGSGSQMESAVHKACTNGLDVDVLLCPIIICPVGSQLARRLAEQYPRLTYSPVLEIPESHFLKQRPVVGEEPDYERFRQTLSSIHNKVKGTPGSWQQERGPLGWRETGAIFAKYDNCPDNTVPALHHKSNLGWEPLFYRSSREAI